MDESIIEAIGRSGRVEVITGQVLRPDGGGSMR